MSAPLAGKAVLVTGASAGIGRAAAVALAQKGAKIIATERRRARRPEAKLFHRHGYHEALA